LASPVRTVDYHMLFAPLASQTGLKRPVLGIGGNGNLITDAEVRAVEREYDYLVYASNLTSNLVEFDLKGTKKLGTVLDLRSLTIIENAHIKLGPYQETIFKVEKIK